MTTLARHPDRAGASRPAIATDPRSAAGTIGHALPVEMTRVYVQCDNGVVESVSWYGGDSLVAAPAHARIWASTGEVRYQKDLTGRRRNASLAATPPGVMPHNQQGWLNAVPLESR